MAGRAPRARSGDFELAPIPDATLTADPDRLAQALRNLIRNAVEHTERARRAGAAGGARAARRRWCASWCCDDGPGIDDDELEQVFERFHRTDDDRSRKTGGAGLGLAIVRAIARAHGGEARAVHSPGGGARLELDLPRLHVMAAPPEAGPGAMPETVPRPAAPVEAAVARGPRPSAADPPDAS